MSHSSLRKLAVAKVTPMYSFEEVINFPQLSQVSYFGHLGEELKGLACDKEKQDPVALSFSELLKTR